MKAVYLKLGTLFRWDMTNNLEGLQGMIRQSFLEELGVQVYNERMRKLLKDPKMRKNLKVYHGVERYSKQWEIAIKSNLK